MQEYGQELAELAEMEKGGNYFSRKFESTGSRSGKKSRKSESGRRKSSSKGEMNRSVDRRTFEEDGMINAAYSRLMSASQTNKVRKLIGTRGPALDVIFVQ